MLLGSSCERHRAGALGLEHARRPALRLRRPYTTPPPMLLRLLLFRCGGVEMTHDELPYSHDLSAYRCEHECLRVASSERRILYDTKRARAHCRSSLLPAGSLAHSNAVHPHHALATTSLESVCSHRLLSRVDSAINRRWCMPGKEDGSRKIAAPGRQRKERGICNFESNPTFDTWSTAVLFVFFFFFLLTSGG